MGYKNKKVFVTGAAGFIGAALCRALLEKGANVTRFDLKFKLHEDLLTNVNFKYYEGDIADIKSFEKIIKEQEIIFHLAAQPSVFYSMKHPLEDFKVNALGTVLLLDIIKDSNVKFVYPSSIAVHDGKKEGKYKETEASPCNPYALSKITCESYIKMFAELYGLNATVLRFGYVFGEDCNRGPVFDIFDSLLQDKEEITLYMDPESRIDFIYIDDAVGVFLMVGENDKIKGEVINASISEGKTIHDIVKDISSLFNKEKIKIKLHGDAKNNRKILILDNTKARNMLKWKPKFSLNMAFKRIYDIKAAEDGHN